MLKDAANKDVAQRLKAAVDKIPATHAEPALVDCRAIVMEARALWQHLIQLSRAGGTLSVPLPFCRAASARCCCFKHLELSMSSLFGPTCNSDCRHASESHLQANVPEELQTELKAKMEAAGIPVPDSQDRWAKALEALKVVPQPTFPARQTESFRN